MPKGGVGRMLKVLREARGLTQTDLARKAKVTQAYIAQLEGGVKKNPSLAILRRIAKILEVPVSTILPETDQIKIKAYLDTDMVSARARRDMPKATMGALKRLWEFSEAGRLKLVTSEVAFREIERAKDPRLKKVYRFLEKVEFIEDQELRGFNFHGGSWGWVSSPRHEEHPTSSALRQQGLERMDAHHLMLAVINRCDVFITCDRGILRRRAEIERVFKIRVMRPEELVAELKKGN